MTQPLAKDEQEVMHPTFEAGWIADVTKGRLLQGSPSDPSWGVSTDTRALQSDQLFVALRGERFDAHAFLGKCGLAAGVIVDEEGVANIADLPPRTFVVVVKDTHRALLDLASAYLGLLDAKVIAVTGSAGKTTTKDILGALLQGHHVATTIGNFNNRVGLPLSVLAARPDTRVFVAELGISEPGEMDELAAVVTPEVAILTSIASAHLEGLGTTENVLREKGRMLLHMTPGETTFIYPRDVEAESLEGFSLMSNPWSFDIDTGEGHIASAEWKDGRYIGEVVVGGRKHSFKLKLPGKHNLKNLVAAALGVHALGISPNFDALESFENSAQRSRLETVGGFRVLDDTYNANPASMIAALEATHELAGDNKAHAVCGDMLELGHDAAELHREIGAYASELGFATFVGFGDFGQDYLRGAHETNTRIKTIATCVPEEAAGHLLQNAKAGDIILFKGSRGARTERVLQALQDSVGGRT